MASAAAPRTVYGDGIAFLETHDAFADRRHPASVFVAKRERRLESKVLLHHVQIRVAHAGATDLDQHLAWTGRRFRDVVDLSRDDRRRQI